MKGSNCKSTLLTIFGFNIFKSSVFQDFSKKSGQQLLLLQKQGILLQEKRKFYLNYKKHNTRIYLPLIKLQIILYPILKTYRY